MIYTTILNMLTILIRHTIGRRELLRRCIASILEQEGNYDIVISYDYDMSSEDMIYVVEFFGEELPFGMTKVLLKILQWKPTGLKRMINTIVQTATNTMTMII